MGNTESSPTGTVEAHANPPSDVWRLIIDNIEYPAQHITLSQICSSSRAVYADDAAWQKLCHRIGIGRPVGDKRSWKEVYMRVLAHQRKCRVSSCFKMGMHPRNAIGDLLDSPERLRQHHATFTKLQQEATNQRYKKEEEEMAAAAAERQAEAEQRQGEGGNPDNDMHNWTDDESAEEEAGAAAGGAGAQGGGGLVDAFWGTVHPHVHGGPHGLGMPAPGIHPMAIPLGGLGGMFGGGVTLGPIPVAVPMPAAAGTAGAPTAGVPPAAAGAAADPAAAAQNGADEDEDSGGAEEANPTGTAAQPTTALPGETAAGPAATAEDDTAAPSSTASATAPVEAAIPPELAAQAAADDAEINHLAVHSGFGGLQPGTIAEDFHDGMDGIDLEMYQAVFGGAGHTGFGTPSAGPSTASAPAAGPSQPTIGLSSAPEETEERADVSESSSAQTEHDADADGSDGTGDAAPASAEAQPTEGTAIPAPAAVPAPGPAPGVGAGAAPTATGANAADANANQPGDAIANYMNAFMQAMLGGPLGPAGGTGAGGLAAYGPLDVHTDDDADNDLTNLVLGLGPRGKAKNESPHVVDPKRFPLSHSHWRSVPACPDITSYLCAGGNVSLARFFQGRGHECGGKRGHDRTGAIDHTWAGWDEEHASIVEDGYSLEDHAILKGAFATNPPVKTMYVQIGPFEKRITNATGITNWDVITQLRTWLKKEMSPKERKKQFANSALRQTLRGLKIKPAEIKTRMDMVELASGAFGCNCGTCGSGLVGASSMDMKTGKVFLYLDVQ